MSQPTYSRAEVARHNKRDDLWIIIDDDVYDLTDFGFLHPGGIPPLLDVAGQDATDLFYGLHRRSVLEEPRFAQLRIGKVEGSSPPIAASVENVIPYGEAMGYWRRKSPYYKKSHHDFRAALREFVDREIRPDAIVDDEEGNYPTQELNEKMGRFGLLACLVAMEPKSWRWIRAAGISLPGGVKLEEFDFFHNLIMSEELRRLGTYGLGDGLIAGNGIGLPVIIKFGSEELCKRIVVDVLLGKERCALAITEPYAGSDVAQIKTSAVRSPDGRSFIVSGVKKWITGGMFARYFSTLTKTKAGHTLIVVDRALGGDNFSTKQIMTSYSKAAGTSYVTIDAVQVPITNVIGEEGRGFMYTMSNFNTERWAMVCAGNRLSRLMVEECFRWALCRRVFSKPLVKQPVIRFKLAQMAAEVEAVHSFLEDVTYQMCNTPSEDLHRLAGVIALLKYKQTRVAQLVADNACQIFGGRALTRSGMGVLIEKFHRSQKMQAILGGSEEILADLAMRQAVKSVGKGEAAKPFSRL